MNKHIKKYLVSAFFSVVLSDGAYVFASVESIKQTDDIQRAIQKIDEKSLYKDENKDAVVSKKGRSSRLQKIKNENNKKALQKQKQKEEQNKSIKADEENSVGQAQQQESAELAAQEKKSKDNEEKVSINYQDEDLVNVINFFASKKQVNILLPQGGNAIKEKVTLNLTQKMSIDKVWNELLPTILDVAGFSMVPKEDGFVIVKNDKEIAREPMPIYIGTKPEDLPQTDQRIRYMYYLTNIKITDSSKSEFDVIIKELMPADTKHFTDASANALLIVGKSNDIKGVMDIVLQLDQGAQQEKMSIIELNHTLAGTVAELFANIVSSKSEMNRYRLDTRNKNEATYFSQHIRLIPEPRTNRLIVMGKKQAVDRVRDFIEEYIDVEMEGGKSILHVRQLLYLDAIEFAEVLRKIVASTRPGGTGQSRGNANAGSTERFFEEVIIFADTPSQSGSKGENKAQYYGGNNLVVAARNDDWVVIEELIQSLDQPQRQVLIEVLIADLTVDDRRRLGATLRNPAKIPLPADINIQSAQATPIILDASTAVDATTLKSDLLRKGVPSVGDGSAAALFPAGTSLFSLNDNDGKTWSLLHMLKSFNNTKILSHPHVIATNNQVATVVVGQTRLLPDEGQATNSAATQKFKEIPGELTVSITPRISSEDEINLQVLININEFSGITLSDNTRIVRTVDTNANVTSESVLAIGGLIRNADSSTTNATPILGRVPILGWFFKNRNATAIQTNLTVFIKTTIIEPKLRHGVGQYTQDYSQVVKDYASEGMLFDTLKEPITRWFFKTDVDSRDVIDEFLERDEFKINFAERMPGKKSKEFDLDRKQDRKQMRTELNRRDRETRKHAAAPKRQKNRRRRNNNLKDIIKDEDNPFKNRDQIPTHLQF